MMTLEELTLPHLEAMIAGVKQTIVEHEREPEHRFRRVDLKTCAFCVVDRTYSERMCTACPPVLILGRKCITRLNNEERLKVFKEEYLPALEAELARRS